MDFWNRARSFAEEAAKRSQELTKEAARRSQEMTISSSKLVDIVSETAKRSKEIAAEASKKADQIKLEAIKRADQIKSFAESSGALSITDSIVLREEESSEEVDLEKFGVTEELREFVREINVTTFQDFPLQDDSEMSNVPTVSNVSQDLTEFQEKHAKLVLSTVKEISKLRYELCPRTMKERKFWRIYFILVNKQLALYEKRYIEDIKLRASEESKAKGAPKAGESSNSQNKEPDQQNKKSTSPAAEQDLDVFLLGDPGDSDEGPDDGDVGLDDVFDKMVDESDDEKKS